MSQSPIDGAEVVAATADYEAWVDRHTPTVAAARDDKHARMASGVFPFLRATYFRWVALVRAVPPAPGPVVAAVGDLHVENFGTWRDAEGRLVWGINDLDEVAELPAALDLLRLATSVELAGLHGCLALPAVGVVELLTAGYARALGSDGLPAVLDRPGAPPLATLLPAGRQQRWWATVLAEPLAQHPPAQAVGLLARSLPPGAGPVAVHRRTAGLGSRDHLRLVGLAELHGAPVVREVKARTPAATRWLAGDPPRHGAGDQAVLRRILGGARHVPDPGLRFTARWVVRRLAPWSDRIELTDLRRRADVAELLSWMGSETANLHLASASAAELGPLTRRRARAWLAAATAQMVAATTADFDAWRRAAANPRKGAG